MRRTARVLVVHRGRVLAIAHDDDLRSLGLPGGGIERGETIARAARREVREETGLAVQELTPLLVIDEVERRSYVFCGTASGTLRSSAEGRALWADPTALVNGRFGPFHELVFEEAGL